MTQNIWQDRLYKGGIFKKMIWKAIYYIGRVFSLGRWNPFKKYQETNEAPNFNAVTRVINQESKPTTTNPVSVRSALVIGFSITNTNDVNRYKSFFNKAVDIYELPGYITRDFKIINILTNNKVINADTLFDRTIAYYCDEYRRYFTNNFENTLFDLIITDRGTTHGLVIDHPISYANDISSFDKQQREDFNSLFNKKIVNNDQSDQSEMQKDILCLLFVNILTKINSGGFMIVDAAYLSDRHIHILDQYFTFHTAWDYKQYPMLEFSRPYESGSYSKPNFIKFEGKNNTIPNFNDLVTKLKNENPVFNSSEPAMVITKLKF